MHVFNPKILTGINNMRLLKFDYRCRLSLFIILAAIVVLSCSGNEKDLKSESMDGLPTYTVDELDSELPKLTIDSVATLDGPEFMESYYLETIPEKGLVVTNDRTENLIHLFDEMGNYLGSGGGQGRGPGEFTSTVNPHAGWDNDIYVLETGAFRISQFSVNREGFSYVATHSISLGSAATWLQDIYVTEWGNFGVTRSLVDFKTGEEQFHFYKLDDSFNQDELLITMPGNEKMSIGGLLPIDHIIGEKTYWDLDGEWFYHISSNSPVINKYNLETGESTTVTYFGLEDRVITESTWEHVLEYASNLIERFPIVEDEVENTEVLPFFREFMVQDDMLYLVLLDVTGREETEIIRINSKTEEVRYLKIPSKLFRIKVGNEMLYGTNSTAADPSVRFVKLTE